MNNQDEDGNMRDMTDQEIRDENARLLDEADEREAETDRRISSYISNMTLLDFSQMFSDADRLNKNEMLFEFHHALIRLRVALSLRFSPGMETEGQKIIRDQLIAEAMTELCEVIGIE